MQERQASELTVKQWMLQNMAGKYYYYDNSNKPTLLTKEYIDTMFSVVEDDEEPEVVVDENKIKEDLLSERFININGDVKTENMFSKLNLRGQSLIYILDAKFRKKQGLTLDQIQAYEASELTDRQEIEEDILSKFNYEYDVDKKEFVIQKGDLDAEKIFNSAKDPEYKFFSSLKKKAKYSTQEELDEDMKKAAKKKDYFLTGICKVSKVLQYPGKLHSVLQKTMGNTLGSSVYTALSTFVPAIFPARTGLASIAAKVIVGGGVLAAAILFPPVGMPLLTAFLGMGLIASFRGLIKKHEEYKINAKKVTLGIPNTQTIKSQHVENSNLLQNKSEYDKFTSNPDPTLNTSGSDAPSFENKIQRVLTPIEEHGKNKLASDAGLSFEEDDVVYKINDNAYLVYNSKSETSYLLCNTENITDSIISYKTDDGNCNYEITFNINKDSKTFIGDVVTDPALDSARVTHEEVRGRLGGAAQSQIGGPAQLQQVPTASSERSQEEGPANRSSFGV